MDENEITTAAAWAAQRKTKPLLLPSGVVVEVVDSMFRSLDILSDIPMPLLSRIIKSASDSMDLDPDEKRKLLEFNEKVMKMIRAIVVRPKIALEVIAPEGEMSFMNMLDIDRKFLMRYVLGTKGAEDLSSFRGRADGDPSGSVLPSIRSESVGGHEAGR
jgi:hypothetical protein